MEVFGKPTINKVFFVTAKVSLILCALAVPFQWFFENIRYLYLPQYLIIASLILFFIGLIIIGVSIKNMGDSIRVGIPTSKTKLKSNGLFRISRNPIYLGADLVAISTIIFTLNPFILILGIHSIIVHHFIILSEEKYLRQSFGKQYTDYSKKVRRYL